MKRVSMEGDVVGFFWGEGMCCAPQQPLGFATTLNMWDLIGCLELDNLYHRLQLLPTIGFDFVTTSVPDHQGHTLLRKL